MDAATLIRTARTGRRLTLRRLARLAGTSHATLAAYEGGRVDPSTATLGRIVRAAGYDVDVTLRPRVGGDAAGDRGDELLAVLELAALFPARPAGDLEFPRFGAA